MFWDYYFYITLRLIQFLSSWLFGLPHWSVPNCPAHRWQNSFLCLPTRPCLFMAHGLPMAPHCHGNHMSWIFQPLFFFLIQIFCHVVKPCVRLYAKGYVLTWDFKYDYELLPRWLSFILSNTAKAKASPSTPFITLAEDFYISINMDCLIPVLCRRTREKICSLEDEKIKGRSGWLTFPQWPDDGLPVYWLYQSLPRDAFSPRFVHYLGSRESLSGAWLKEAGSFLA